MRTDGGEKEKKMFMAVWIAHWLCPQRSSEQPCSLWHSQQHDLFFCKCRKKIRNGCTSHKHENSLFTFCSLILCGALLYYHFHNNQTRPFFSLTSRTNELAPDTSASSFPFLSVLFHFCTPQLPPNTPKDQPEAAYTLARLEVLSSSASALTHNSPLGHCQFQNEPQKNSMPLTQLLYSH